MFRTYSLFSQTFVLASPNQHWLASCTLGHTESCKILLPQAIAEEDRAQLGALDCLRCPAIASAFPSHRRLRSDPRMKYDSEAIFVSLDSATIISTL